jgi:hypothetical protein
MRDLFGRMYPEIADAVMCGDLQQLEHYPGMLRDCVAEGYGSEVLRAALSLANVYMHPFAKDIPERKAIAEQRAVETLRWLVSHGVPVDSRGPDGKTVLHLAIEHGRDAVAQQLLELGASVDLRDNDGACALDVARAHSRSEMTVLINAWKARSRARQALEAIAYVPPSAPSSRLSL